MWGDSVAPLEPGSVAMVTQSGNVGVNALRPARGSAGTPSSRPATRRSATPATGSTRSPACPRSGPSPCSPGADGDGARLAEALALCAERDVGVAVLKVGASQAGAVAAAAHTGSLAGDQRIFRALVEEAGAAWAEDPHELLELARALAEPRARPASAASAGCRKAAQGTRPPTPGARRPAGWRSSPARGRLRRRSRPGRPARHRAAPAGAGHAWAPGGTPAPGIANPLDYTAMIWGDADRLARIIQAVGDDAAIDQLLLCYDHPRDLSRESEASWAAVREGIVQGAKQARAGTLVCSTSRT